MCKNDNFSCLKTKPYRSKRCKVLTNQYADKKREGDCSLFFGTPEGTQLNPSCGRNKSHLRGMKSLRDEIRLCREKDGFNFIQAVGLDFICIADFILAKARISFYLPIRIENAFLAEKISRSLTVDHFCHRRDSVKSTLSGG